MKNNIKFPVLKRRNNKLDINLYEIKSLYNEKEKMVIDDNGECVNLDVIIGHCILCNSEIHYFSKYSIFVCNIGFGLVCEKHRRTNFNNIYTALINKNAQNSFF